MHFNEISDGPIFVFGRSKNLKFSPGHYKSSFQRQDAQLCAIKVHNWTNNTLNAIKHENIGFRVFWHRRRRKKFSTNYALNIMGFFRLRRVSIAGFWPEGGGWLQGFRRTSDLCILASMLKFVLNIYFWQNKLNFTTILKLICFISSRQNNKRLWLFQYLILKMILYSQMKIWGKTIIFT